jgi:hypothetical protein
MTRVGAGRVSPGRTKMRNARLVPEISSTSFGLTLPPRYGASGLRLRLLDSALPSAWSGDSLAQSSLRHSPVSVRRFLLAPTPLLVAIPCSSSRSVPIWPPVETSRLGDISIVVTSWQGDISNVAEGGHYQCRATEWKTKWKTKWRLRQVHGLHAGGSGASLGGTVEADVLT